MRGKLSTFSLAPRGVTQRSFSPTFHSIYEIELPYSVIVKTCRAHPRHLGMLGFRIPSDGHARIVMQHGQAARRHRVLTARESIMPSWSIISWRSRSYAFDGARVSDRVPIGMICYHTLSSDFVEQHCFCDPRRRHKTGEGSSITNCRFLCSSEARGTGSQRTCFWGRQRRLVNRRPAVPVNGFA